MLNWFIYTYKELFGWGLLLENLRDCKQWFKVSAHISAEKEREEYGTEKVAAEVPTDRAYQKGGCGKLHKSCFQSSSQFQPSNQSPFP